MMDSRQSIKGCDRQYWLSEIQPVFVDSCLDVR